GCPGAVAGTADGGAGLPDGGVAGAANGPVHDGSVRGAPAGDGVPHGRGAGTAACVPAGPLPQRRRGADCAAGPHVAGGAEDDARRTLPRPASTPQSTACVLLSTKNTRTGVPATGRTDPSRSSRSSSALPPTPFPSGSVKR